MSHQHCRPSAGQQQRGTAACWMPPCPAVPLITCSSSSGDIERAAASKSGWCVAICWASCFFKLRADRKALSISRHHRYAGAQLGSSWHTATERRVQDTADAGAAGRRCSQLTPSSVHCIQSLAWHRFRRHHPSEHRALVPRKRCSRTRPPAPGMAAPISAPPGCRWYRHAQAARAGRQEMAC